jgi:hypothetical protein
MQKLGILYSINKQKQVNKQLEEKVKPEKGNYAFHNESGQHEKQINRLLDIYNDYQVLYEWFGDEEYLQVMKAAIRELQKLTKN